MNEQAVKFWRPFLISIAVTLVAIVVAVIGAGTSHGTTPSDGGLVVLVFPYATLANRLFGNGLIPFLFQFPIYGTIVGFASVKGKLRTSLWWLVALHLFIYAVTSLLT